jgi:CheY-like chemotaxis protein
MHMSGAGSRNSDSRKIRILVIDDNADAAHSLGRLLSLLGKEVRVALDGEAGIAALESFAADVVLLDLGMHGMDGFETAQAIRSRPDWNNVALVALTGWGQEQDRQRTLDAGFAAHLVKPVNIDQVEATISRAMNAPSALAQ